MKTDEEIEEQIDKATEWINKGQTAVSGMTYEEGVRSALDWAIGNMDEKPIEKECPE